MAQVTLPEKEMKALLLDRQALARRVECPTCGVPAFAKGMLKGKRRPGSCREGPGRRFRLLCHPARYEAALRAFGLPPDMGRCRFCNCATAEPDEPDGLCMRCAWLVYGVNRSARVPRQGNRAARGGPSWCYPGMGSTAKRVAERGRIRAWVAETVRRLGHDASTAQAAVLRWEGLIERVALVGGPDDDDD